MDPEAGDPVDGGDAARRASPVRVLTPVVAATELGRGLPRHLRRTGLVEPGSRVLIALSGGLDSVVLLHAARFLLSTLDLDVHAAHFDHAMRAGSAADASWVRGLCRAWGVPLYTERAPVPPRSEADARALRYEFLETAAERAGACAVWTAHHADDQAETVLFRAIRGTGIAGLAGIRERRGNLVRPLLPFSRAQLDAYATAAGIRYRLDPTNTTSDYARNRIRNEVMPLLESISPGAGAALARLATLAQQEQGAREWMLDRLVAEATTARTEDAVELALPILRSYHPAIRAQLLRRLLRQFGSVPGRAGTLAALEFINSGAGGGQIHVAGGARLERHFDRIRITRAATMEGKPADRTLLVPAVGDGSGEVILGGRRFVVQWTSASRELTGASETFDASALPFPLRLRGWQPGDRIRLPFGTKKLKKLFSERRVDRADRNRIPVLVDRAGRILWVVGLARATHARAREGGPVLTIAVRDAGIRRD
ncbi:MAG TPA: tRNA lysidine(34) synthetase TilS [Longimicrobiales bacterium]|nr:tRNA lysidine(34) synthetase TilS [Longimicrobiales bacterium]